MLIKDKQQKIIKQKRVKPEIKTKKWHGLDENQKKLQRKISRRSLRRNNANIHDCRRC